MYAIHLPPDWVATFQEDHDLPTTFASHNFRIMALDVSHLDHHSTKVEVFIE
jgi:hypothetical protein